jgi:mono/diheme cytochrome c family protein
MSSRRLELFTIVAALALFAPAAPAQTTAQTPSAALSPGFTFSERSGEDLYANVCRACHMPDGRGAIGAGAYPPLADDKSLAAGAYPVAVVVNGLRGMPPVGEMMSDDQVAAVVNYVRTHFGNTYQDAVKPEDVKAIRR